MAITTRRGLLFLFLGLFLAVLGLLLTIPPISFVGRFISLCGYISMLLGAYFIFKGRKVKEGSHQRMALAGFLIVAGASIVLLLNDLYRGGLELFGISRNIESGIYGSELTDLLRKWAPFIWIEGLTVLIGALGWALLIWNITSRLGKIFVVLFVVATIGSSMGGAILLQSALDDHVDDIDDAEIFSEKEADDMVRELTLKMYPSTLMRLTDLLFLMIALLPALKLVNERVKESYIAG